MEYITLTDRKIPLVYTPDIFIAGGGCAGKCNVRDIDIKTLQGQLGSLL